MVAMCGSCSSFIMSSRRLRQACQNQSSERVTQNANRWYLNSWELPNIPFGQLRVALQSVFDCLHRGLAEYNALGIDRAAECDDGMDPLPRHTLSPLQPRLPLHQLRPIPVPCQEPPATLDGMICAVGGWRIQQLDGRANRVGNLDHAM